MPQEKIQLAKIKIDPLTDFWKGEKKLAMCEANYTHDVGQ